MEQNPYEAPNVGDASQPKSGRFRFTWPKLLVLTLLFAASGFIWFAVWAVLFGLPPTWTNIDYDKERYRQIRNAIAADPKHLLGKYLDEVTKSLSLEDVPWDDASAGVQHMGQFRIYHFRGFALYVTVDLPPPRDLPVSKKRRYAEEDLPRPRLTYSPPRVRIDGLNDRQERMKRFWKALDEECERINSEAEKANVERLRHQFQK